MIWLFDSHNLFVFFLVVSGILVHIVEEKVFLVFCVACNFVHEKIFRIFAGKVAKNESIKIIFRQKLWKTAFQKNGIQTLWRNLKFFRQRTGFSEK